MSGPTAPRDLGDGLVLRWATSVDVERVAEFNALAFRDEPDQGPLPWDRAVTRELMSGRHPLVGAEDYVYVEATATGAIVASSCLMRQRWEYEGIPFDVGRPEHVATDPGYRNRGLIRAIFGALHELSAALGQPVQAITGIPYFYRQFGYEYALDLEGGRIVMPAGIPDAPSGEPEPYALRDATPDDIPFISALYDQRRADSAVSAVVPEAYWRYAFVPFGTPAAPQGEFNRQWRLRIIADRAGAACGYVRTGTMLWGETFYVWDLTVRDGVSLRAAALPALRALLAAGAEAQAAAHAAGQTDAVFKRIMLCMEREHPLYAALGERIAPLAIPPYAWYVRVPDQPDFLRRITPVLERRLAASPMAAHTGELRLDFYRGGLRLTFTDGRLTAVAPWQRPIWGERQHASFPPLVFLQLLFGRRSLAELRDAYPDVRATDEAAALLAALFPKRVSRVAALD
jgi:predicted N-acetyltransferase YhbS